MGEILDSLWPDRDAADWIAVGVLAHLAVPMTRRKAALLVLLFLGGCAITPQRICSPTHIVGCEGKATICMDANRQFTLYCEP